MCPCGRTNDERKQVQVVGCAGQLLVPIFPAGRGMRMKLATRCSLHARRPATRLHSGAVTPRQQQQQAAEQTLRPHVLATAPRVEAPSSASAIKKDEYAKSPGGLLTRDFIAQSLYNQENGYFSTKDVINDLPGPLEFGSMMGELHYRLDVKKAYESKLSAWMTPVETFSPHYSNALAKFIAREAKKAESAPSSRARRNPGRHAPHGRSPGVTGPGGGKRSGDAGGEGLVLYEAGGGTGTNALNVLDWLRKEEPKLYERTEYTIVEISPRLAELQTERVCKVHENCRVVNENVLEWGMSGEVDPRPCFFLGMELLDNLPHDKIAWMVPSLPEDGENLKEQLCEAVVVETADAGFREAFRPLRDPVIRELLTICPELAAMVRNRRESESSGGAPASDFRKAFARFFGSGGGGLRPEHCAAFVPTGSLRLVQVLMGRLPRHRAILADFDSFDGSMDTPGAGTAGAGGSAAGLPAKNDESLTAFQAPIVSSREAATGNVTDHATYMVPLGSADIFFPTCFERLARLHSAVCSSGGGGGGSGGGDVIRRGRGAVVKQGEFLREFADLHATRTFSGFNPLVDDFRNSSVFISGAVISR